MHLLDARLGSQSAAVLRPPPLEAIRVAGGWFVLEQEHLRSRVYRPAGQPESQFVRVHHVCMVETVMAHLEVQVITKGSCRWAAP